MEVFCSWVFSSEYAYCKAHTPDIALEFGLSASCIQKHMSLTAPRSSQRAQCRRAGLIFLPFLQRRRWGKTLETQAHISLKAQLQETCMNFWGWHTRYLVPDLSGLGKLSWTQGKVWAARQIWCPRGGQQALRKVSELPEVRLLPGKVFPPRVLLAIALLFMSVCEDVLLSWTSLSMPSTCPLYCEAWTNVNLCSPKCQGPFPSIFLSWALTPKHCGIHTLSWLAYSSLF